MEVFLGGRGRRPPAARTEAHGPRQACDPLPFPLSLACSSQRLVSVRRTAAPSSPSVCGQTPTSLRGSGGLKMEPGPRKRD